MMLTSLILFGGSAFIIQEALDVKVHDAARKAADEKQCLKQLSQIPGATVTNGANIVVTLKGMGNPAEALTTASMAIMTCPTRDMTSLCLGDECDKSGQVSMNFMLSPKKGK